METFAELDHGEILNSSHYEWPLLEGVIYRDATLSIKLAKRLACGVKHLPLEGLTSAEEITVIFKQYL